MTRIFRHIAALLYVALAVVMTACGSHYDMPQDPVDDGKGAFLVFNIGMVGNTRANEDPVIETMHSLRIVILNNNGVVESNEYFEFGSGRQTYSHVTELKSRSKKKVYLFSNEKSVSDIQCEPANVSLSGSLHDFLESVTEGASDFEAKIAAINYAPDFSQPIPLNAKYDVEIPEGVRYVEKSFWLVRVATKFTFTFINNRRYDDITIESFRVDGLSDRHFFMPRFTRDQIPVFPGFPTWIDWLKDVSDKTQIDPDNPTADESGWLTAYDIPTDAKSVELTYNKPFTLAHAAVAGEQGGGMEIPDIYACESKHLRTDNGNVIANEQQYTLHVKCSGIFNSTDIVPDDGTVREDRTFDVVLPNIRALFRNTHPHVIVTINDGEFEVNAVVDVVPYRGCILKPYFGLQRD